MWAPGGRICPQPPGDERIPGQGHPGAPRPFTVELTLFQEQEIAADIRNLSVGMVLKNTQYRWRLRGFFTLVRRQTSWRLRTLWFSEPSSSQRGEEHYPKTLVMENMARQRQELLNDSLPGGMMGGYIEEGFPFFLRQQSDAGASGLCQRGGFCGDIRGLVTNCMHPDDRAMVDAEVDSQMAEGGQYVVEYRMKKQDGSYIWVHDMGRRITAEDGKPAIISVCIDITAQKMAQAEVMHLYNNVPGAVFRCRYDEGFSVVSANDGLYKFLGYTRQEFAALGNRMSKVVHPEDQGSVQAKLELDQDRDGTVQDEHRLVCRDGSVRWVSLKAQRLTEDDGNQYFYGVFVDITEEKQVQARVRELYEKEMSYFAQAASAEGE